MTIQQARVETLISPSSLRDRKRRIQANKLNELSGKDWIKFTKSWFVHRPEPRGDQKVRHPASFPESPIREFILFFTKRHQIIVDPFLGTGSSIVAAVETGRSGIGFEIAGKYAEISKKRIATALNGRENDGEPAQKNRYGPKLSRQIRIDSQMFGWRNDILPLTTASHRRLTGTS